MRQKSNQCSEVAEAALDIRSSKATPQVTRASETLPYWAPLVFGLFLACFLGELDKVNLSVAVVPLSEQFAFSEAEVGIASTAFFWGYMLTQLPAAWLNEIIPGVQLQSWHWESLFSL